MTLDHHGHDVHDDLEAISTLVRLAAEGISQDEPDYEHALRMIDEAIDCNLSLAEIRTAIAAEA
jgi:hypothetical protein